MQRIAILSDIHGNLTALDAVLAALAADGIARIVCLGDVATLGPQPHAVIARLRALACPVVMGNTDAALLATEPDAAAIAAGDWSNDAFDRWSAAQLTAEDLAYVRTFQPAITVSLGDVTLLCYHGSPRSFDELITAETPDATLHEMLAETPAQLYAGGHTHQQLLRRHRDVLVLNPGTVGFAKDAIAPAAPVRNPSWAEYAVVTSDNGGQLDVSLRRVPFDLDAHFAVLDATGIPRTQWRIGDWRRA